MSALGDLLDSLYQEFKSQQNAQPDFSGSGYVGGVKTPQTAIVYDLLSEGPVEGLVDGVASIYVNGTRLVNDNYVNKIFPMRISSAVFVASNTTVTANGFFANVSADHKYIILERGKANSSIFSGTAGSTRVTATGFFTTGMFTNANYINALSPRLRITGLGPEGDEYIGVLKTYINANTAEVYPPISTTGSNKAGGLDLITTIVSKTSNTAVVNTAPSVGGTKIQALPPLVNANAVLTDDRWNFKETSASFRTGRLDQLPIAIEGVPTASFLTSIDYELKWSNVGNFGGTQLPYSISATSLGATEPSEIDKLKITMEFPSGLYTNGGASGSIGVGFVILQIKLQYTQGGVNKTVLIAGPKDNEGPGYGTGVKAKVWRDWGDENGKGGYLVRKATTPYVEEYEINLEQYKPFTNFTLTFARVSPDDSQDYNFDDAILFSLMRIKHIECQVMDKFSYPYSAYAVVTFPAEGFSSPPTRAYHLRGLKIKVPSNYTTREEGGSASYTGTWDGTFRTAYCNNPAWVFYDLATNKRYGLGKYIDSSYVNKYALYTIARYCDELVPDGRGGTEPRFVCNVYLSSTEEAYKVLRDLATTFRGLLYWMEGQLTAVQDSPKEPIYTFTQGNIVDGIFSYEYTGSLTRYNEVNVTWNNPDQFYQQDILTVTDATDIIKRGRVVSMDTIAFGCTSPGQAYRVGNWNLITSQYETEITKFKTAINAGFLKPGDIINVQDQHEQAIQASGRVKSASSNTSIVIDRNVTLNSANTYYLHLVYDGPGCYLQQNTANVAGTVYTRGAYIPNVLTEAAAATLLDTSGNPVMVSFSPHVRVEKKLINNSLPYTGNTITVSTAFSNTATAEVMWALENITLDNGVAPKKYRILGISEEDQHLYTIVASNYAEEKYDELERKVTVKTPTFTGPRPTDEVPPVSNLMAVLARTGETSDSSSFQGYTYDGIISWDAPTETYVDSSGALKTRVYPYIDRFEVEHNLSDNPVTTAIENIKEIVPGTQSQLIVKNVASGVYTIRVRIINTIGQFSNWLTKQFTLISKNQIGGTSLLGLTRGGSLDAGLTFQSNTITLTDSDYSFTSAAGVTYSVIGATANQSSQSFASLPSSSVYYLLHDASNTSDPWKAMSIVLDSTIDSPVGVTNQFWKEATSTTGLTQLTGNVTVTQFTNLLSGSGTLFNTELVPGTLVKIGTGATAFYATISSINSNTVAYTSEVIQKPFTANNIYKQAFDVDYTLDTICAKISTDGANTATLTEQYVTSSISEPQLIILSASGQLFSYYANTTLIGPSQIDFLVNRQNLLEATQWAVFDSNNNNIGNTYLANKTNTSATLNATSFGSITNNAFVKIEVSADGFLDYVSIYELTEGDGADGANAVSGFLTNDTFAAAANSTGGSIDYTGNNGAFKVFDGTLDITTGNGTTYNVVGNTGSGGWSNVTTNNLTFSMNTSTGLYQVSGASWSSNVATFTANAVTNASHGSLTIQKVYTITKVWAGQTGSAGANGANSVIGFLTNEAFVAAANSTGGSIDYTGNNGAFKVYDGTLDITTGNGTVFNVVGNTGSGGWSNVTSNNLTFSVNTSTGLYQVSGASWSANVETFTANAVTNSSHGSLTIQKVYSITKAWAGQTGANGANTISGFLTNEAFVAAANSTGGSINYTGNNGVFKVYDGTLDITTGNGTVFNVVGNTGSGGWSNVTANSLTFSVNTSTGLYQVSGASWSANVETFTANAVTNASHGNLTLQKVYTITKAWAGQTGTAGANGANTISGFLTNEAFVAAANSTGSNIDYTGNNGVFKVYDGTLDITTGNGTVFNVVGNTGSGGWSNVTANSLTFSMNTSTGLYQVSGASWSANVETFTANAVTNSSHGSLTIQKVYSITKAWAGQTGANGANTISGFLTNEAFVAAANSTGGSINYTGNNGVFKVYDGTLDITTGNGTVFNVVGNTGSGGWSNVTANSLTFSMNTSTGLYQVSGASWSANTETFTANAVTNASHGSLTLQKVYTITKAWAGQTGSAGANGANTISGFLTNEAFVAAANSTGGSIDYTGNNGVFKVYDGILDITTGNGTAFNVVGNTGSGGWSNVTTNNLTFSVNTSTGLYQVSGASWSSNVATFTANAVTNASHGSLTIQKVYTITKAWAGQTGTAGANSITGFLTNEAFVAAANSTGGSIDYTGNNGVFKVYDGILDITTGNGTAYNVVGNTGAGGWSNVTANSLTFSMNTSTGLYQVSGASWSANVETFTANAVTNASHGSLTLQKVYSITKAWSGQTGSAGANGANTISGFLTNEAFVASANSTGGSIDYTGNNGVFKVYDGTLDITTGNGTVFSVVGNTGSGGWSNVTTNNLTFSMNTSTGLYQVSGASWSSNVQTFTANATTNASHGNLTLQKVYTITKAWAGQTGSSGTNGDAGFSIISSQEAVIVPAESSGAVVSYANTGTTINVYFGITQLTYDNVASYGNNTFRMATSLIGTNITPGSVSNNANSLIIANHSAMTADQASVAIPITIVSNTGTTIGPVTVYQYLNKSRSGFSSIFVEDFRDNSASRFTTTWHHTGTNVITPTVEANTTANTGSGYVLVVGDNSGNDQDTRAASRYIAYGIENDILYRVVYVIRRTQGTANVYLGVAALDHTRANWIQTSGTTTAVVDNGANEAALANSHWFAANNVQISNTAWELRIGYFMRTGGAVDIKSGNTTPANYGILHANTKYITPVHRVNSSGAAGQYKIAYIGIAPVQGAPNTSYVGNIPVDAINGLIDPSGGIVDGGQIGDGSGNYRLITKGLATGSAYDGQAITFTTAWDSIPTIKFFAGGIAQEGYMQFVESTNTTYSTATTSYTWAHGLGQVPDYFDAYLIFTTAENNYSIGDRISLKGADLFSQDGGVTVWANSTHVGVATTVSGADLYLINKTSGAAFNAETNPTNKAVRFIAGIWKTGLGIGTQVIQDFKALNTSTTGFTASLKLRGTSGTLTLVSNTGAAGSEAIPSGGPTGYSLTKTAATEAYNDTYYFQFDVVVKNSNEYGGGRFPGQVDIGLYTKLSAGSWIKRGTISKTGGSGPTTTTHSNVTAAITFDGAVADTKFGIVIEYDKYSSIGPSTINFDKIEWYTAAAGAEVSANVSGTLDGLVPYIVIGGQEG